MAKQAGGLAAFVSTEDSFGRQAKLMRQKLVRPAIEDVAVQFAGSSVQEIEPQELGDLFYGTPLRLQGRYTSSGPVSITLTGTVQGGPWKQTVEVELPKSDEGNSEIERIWAQSRVQRLLAAERAGKGSERDEIVRLSEAYSIVSPYASMLVLENNDEYKRWKIDQRNATRIERDRKSRSTVQEKLADMRRRASEGFEVDRAEKLVSTSDRKAAPSNPQPQSSTPASPSASRPASAPIPSSRGVDLDFSNSRGGGGGGGAIDPITALLALGTAGGAALARRRKQKSGS
jgi:MprA protease rhombosortase-interaction domain-containing protein